MSEPLVDGPDVTVGWAPAVARLLLQCAPDDSDSVARAVGAALPAETLRASTAGAGHALCLAPGEWLLVGPPGQIETILASARGTPAPMSIVDISDRSLVVEIGGRAAETLLAAGCPLDLAASAFREGACSRTLFGKAPVMLWRREHGFWLEFARSYADYVVLLLQTAAAEPL